jgi:NAD(P)-dependent dehydrogenase (short-subunit alcohol dehydrogenase family)
MTIGRDNGPLLVTGAASGIGHAVAVSALEAGVAVALLGRDRERLAALVEDLGGKHGAEAIAVPCDVANADEVDQAIAAAGERLGPFRSLVTSAAIDRGGMVHELALRDFDEVLETNLRGTFLACRACLPQMVEARSGSIVCISSPLGVVATPGSGAYSASKAGIQALVRSLAIDYARYGIRVNGVLPGPTETKLMWATVAETEVDEMRAVVRREVPLGRLAEPREIAMTVVWLLSDAASFVTGAQIPCDGGVLAKASVSI